MRRWMLAIGLIAGGSVAAFAYREWRERTGYGVSLCRGGPSMGRRWSVGLQTLTSIEISGDRVVITGQRLSGGLKEWTSERAVEERALGETTVPDGEWSLSGVRYSDRGAEVSVFNMANENGLCVLLPTGSARPMVASGRGGSGQLLVIAAGDWKLGPESYVAVLTLK